MKSTIAFFFLTLTVFNAKAQESNKWVSLFDGKTLSGWHSFKNPGMTPSWTVKDDAIYLDVTNKQGRGDLVTDKSFEDFHLKFEWKVAPKSNSGLIFLVDEKSKDASWQTGPEFQLIDNTGYPEPLGPKQYSGSLYDLIACPAEYAKPTGEWNKSEIIVEKGRITFIVNDKKVVDALLWDKDWNALIAGSKFAGYKNFAKTSKGSLALQDHGGEVWFKNIMIKNL